MNKNPNQKKFSFKLFHMIPIFCLALLLTSIPEVCAVETSEKTVRVAFLPEMYGFYTLEKNGEYSGYNYDYILNVAQHTGWNIEFVEISEGTISTSLHKAAEMLANKELDIVGPFSQTSSYFEQFETCSNNYGLYRYNIYSARDNYAVTEDNYFLQDSISIALVESYTDINTKFLHLVESRGLNYEITYVQTHAESLDMLLSEQVDTIINLDMSSNAQYLDYLTVVDRIPFYFASTKGNVELIAELDKAIEYIEIIEPDIHQILLERYFGTRYNGEFLFTDEEATLLAEVDSFKVGMLVNEPPYQYLDKNGESVGISVDVLGKLEEIIGISFEIVWKNTHEQLASAMILEEIDLIATVPYDYPLANSLSVTLTNPYISSSAYWLKSYQEVDNPEILFHFISSNIPYFSDSEMRTTFHIESEIRTMNDTGTVSIFCDPNVAAYYLGLNQFDNVEVRTVTDVLSELSLGVGKHIDVNLIGMLNRAILYIDHAELDEYIYMHTSVKPEYTMFDFLRDNAYKICILLLFLATIIVLLVLNTAKKFRDLSRRDGLTKLYNAGYFHDYAGRKIPTLSAGTLIIMDIDYFKQVNDNHGHHKGDEIIKAVAELLKRHFPTDDVVARLGGDEFVVLLEHEASTQDLEKRCQEILEELSHPENNMPVTLSIGGYSFQTSSQYNEMYKKADDELYKVKEKGRNGFSFSREPLVKS